MQSVRPPAPDPIFHAGGLAISTVLTLAFVALADLKVPWLLIPFGLFVLFVAPGYGAAALLFGRRPLSSRAMHLALIVGFSVLINVVLGTLLLLFALGPLAPLLGGADAVVCAVATVVQFRRPKSVSTDPAQGLRAVFALPGFSPVQRTAAYALFAAILVVFAGIGYLSTVHPGPTASLSLGVTGPDGTTATLPTSGVVNGTLSVTVLVHNNDTAQSLVLSVSALLVGQNSTNLTAVPWTMPLRLAPNVTSSDVLYLNSAVAPSLPISFLFSSTGDYRVSFSLTPVGTSIAVRTVAISVHIT